MNSRWQGSMTLPRKRRRAATFRVDRIEERPSGLSEAQVGGKPSAVRGFATVSAAAAVFAVQPSLAAADPGLPTIDQIVSGSAAPGTSAAPAGAPGGGEELALGTGSGASGPGWSVPTGSSAGMVPIPTAGQGLGLDPSGVDAADAADHRPFDLAIATEPTPIDGPGTLGGLLLPDTDLVLPACVGSAALGSAALGSGILTGSGLGSSLVGVGSSGIVGSGSAGAGSVAVGSAAAGSAVLTCMLLLPVPALPELAVPLSIPPTPVVPAVVPAPVRPLEAAPVFPVAIPPAPDPVKPPPIEYAAPAQSSPSPPLTALQIMTVMIITIIAGARARLRGRR
ncbi:hypothetical protein [Nocardia asteroides]|uniref:hypothetical protein n=1 Tax=Nocardia asteroides TaxID=1824 RepID=UPI0036622E0C